LLVRELLKLLIEEDQDRVVVMARDSEGNGYSPLSSMWTAAYTPESTWSGEIQLEPPLTQDLQD